MKKPLGVVTLGSADEREVHEVFAISLTQGCIDQEDVNYSGHKRSKNWTATVTRDVTKPGELERSFWGRGSGSWVKLPSDLVAGDYLEVAADYYSSAGRRSERRSLLRVLAIEADHLILRDASRPNPTPIPVSKDIEACRAAGIQIGTAAAPAAPEPTRTPNPLEAYSDEQLLTELRDRGLRIIVEPSAIVI